MPYIRLPRPRACPKGQLPNGSRVPDEGHLGAHNTDGVGTGLPTAQERGHGGGFGFHSDYVFGGAHDYARVANYYRYHYTGDACNCNGGGEGERLAPAPGTSERAHHAGRAEYRRDGSKFHRLADHVRHLQNQPGHQAANSQQAGQVRDHGVASARQH